MAQWFNFGPESETTVEQNQNNQIIINENVTTVLSCDRKRKHNRDSDHLLIYPFPFDQPDHLFDNLCKKMKMFQYLSNLRRENMFNVEDCNRVTLTSRGLGQIRFHQRDFDLLKEPNWYNDHIIDVWIEW